MRSGSEASSPGSASRAALGWRPGEARLGRLRELLAAATERPEGPDWHDVPDIVCELHPAGIRAVIGYGSWYLDGLRKPASFADVYVVVDDYVGFGEKPFHAWMNRVLPPNVYFLWRDGEDHAVVRGKYNVISSADLERECGPRQRDVYTAGRLTKLLWVARLRDEATREWLLARLVDAHCALAPVALSLLPERFARDDFSLELLGLSYRGEPRLEGWERVRALHGAHAERYRELHGVLLAAFAESTGLLEPAPGGFRKRADAEWARIGRAARRLLRRSRWRGYLRWPRIVLTEPNLADLAASEAERKAGVRIHVTPRLRRHPFLYGLPEFLRVLRERDTQERIR
jgi:hypothetical protein